PKANGERPDGLVLNEGARLVGSIRSTGKGTGEPEPIGPEFVLIPGANRLSSIMHPEHDGVSHEIIHGVDEGIHFDDITHTVDNRLTSVAGDTELAVLPFALGDDQVVDHQGLYLPPDLVSHFRASEFESSNTILT